MIEIEIKGDYVKPLTRWAAGELLDEGVIDYYDLTETDYCDGDDEIDQVVGHWFPIRAEFMLGQTKFIDKIRRL